MAIEVLIPPWRPEGQLSEKATPIANPSKKLCTPSPINTNHATDLKSFRDNPPFEDSTRLSLLGEKTT